jgi:hypothetical protein
MYHSYHEVVWLQVVVGDAMLMHVDHATRQPSVPAPVHVDDVFLETKVQ